MCCCWSFRHPQRFAAGAAGAWRAFDLPKTTDYSCVLAEEKQFEDSDDIVLLDHDEVDLDDLARRRSSLTWTQSFLCSPNARVCAPAAA